MSAGPSPSMPSPPSPPRSSLVISLATPRDEGVGYRRRQRARDDGDLFEVFSIFPTFSDFYLKPT